MVSASFNIPYTGFEAVAPDYKNLDERDFIRQERVWLSGFGNFPEQISDLQKNTFGLYYKRSGIADDRDRDSFTNDNLKKKELTVTASQMKTYFTCPLKWILQTVLKVDEDTLDIDLYENTDMGNINHKALELFLQKRGKSICRKLQP
jgi:ATP-dependent nuclease, subunit B